MTFDIILHHKAHFAVVIIYLPLITYIVCKWPNRSDILIISVLILPFVFFTVVYWDSTVIYTINYCYMLDDWLWDSLDEIPIDDETPLFEGLVEELVGKP